MKRYLIAAVAVLALTGCGLPEDFAATATETPAPEVSTDTKNHRTRVEVVEQTITINDGRKVVCLIYGADSHSGGISCDWPGAGHD